MEQEILIEVGLSAGDVAQKIQEISRQIANAKSEQKFLSDELKKGAITQQDYEMSIVAIKDEIANLTKEQKGLVAQEKVLTATDETYSNTLNGQRQRLNDLTKAYDQLDISLRDSSAGQAFRDEIKAQEEAVQGLEAATGRHQRNVGNYPQVMTSVIPGFDKVSGVISKMGIDLNSLASGGGKAFGSLGKSVSSFGKAFITPPIVIITVVLSAIMMVIQKLSEAFKKNDAAMTALQKAFAIFQPIADAVGAIFDKLASVIASLVTNIANMATSIVSTLVPSMGEAIEKSQELVQAQDDLQQKERDYTENSARRSRDVAKAREEAMQSKDIDERKKKLSEAIELEKENLSDELAIKKEKLRILEETAKKESDTSDETTNKIAEARAAMFRAEEAYYTGTRRLKKELLALDKEEQAKEEQAQREAEERAKKARDEAKKRAKEEMDRRDREARELAERLIREADNEAEIRRMAVDLAVQITLEGYEREREVARLAGEREIEDLQKRLAEGKDLNERAREELTQVIIDKQEQLATKLAKMDEEETARQVDRAREEQELIWSAKKEIADAKEAEDEAERIEKLEMQFEADMALNALKMEQELANLDLTESEKAVLQEKWYALNLAAKRAFENERTAIEMEELEKRRRMAQDDATRVANAFGEMSEALGRYSNDSKAAAVASKTLALAQIAINTGVSIAQGIATATRSSATWIDMLVGIATVIGSVIAGMASAISAVNEAKFATGGIVSGRYDARDSVQASLSGGEMVLNPAQQRKLFDLANGDTPSQGLDYSAMAGAMAVAMSEQPAPVLEYSEFKTFETNVANYNEISKI